MSAFKLEEDAAKGIEKPGIVTILGSDFELVTKVPPSLRRTISADMSSKKWLAQNGCSPMKRIASSEELFAASDSSSVEDDEMNNMPSQDDVWSSIQAQKGKDKLQKSTQLSVWSSILAGKTDSSSNNLPPPYVHPLVRRSAGLLSQKSLEICTESLGSETGSDGFSSCSPSEEGDTEDDKDEAQQQEEGEHKDSAKMQPFEELQVAKYNCSFSSKKIPPRSFPPPLPSLARGDGPLLHVHSHRGNGRLVLQAISVPRQDYLHAERQGDRLLLTLVNSPASQYTFQEEMGDQLQVFDNFVEVEKNEAKLDDEYGYEEEEEEEEQEEDVGKQNDMALAMVQSSSLHKPALMMKRLMVGLNNKDPTWFNKHNKATNLVEEPLPVLQSIPPAPLVARLIPPPPPAAATTFNAYEYFWRNKPTMASRSIKPLSQQCTSIEDNGTTLAKSNSLGAYDQQQDMVLMRGSNRTDHLVPLHKGCKECRRSLLLWQPYCIATS